MNSCWRPTWNGAERSERFPETMTDRLSLDELECLLEVCIPYRACVYIFAAFTGLRRAELMALEWSRLDLD